MARLSPIYDMGNFTENRIIIRKKKTAAVRDNQ